MTNDPRSTPFGPAEANDFVFLVSPAAPTHAVLEFDTAVGPFRFFLDKSQLERLAIEATTASQKVRK